MTQRIPFIIIYDKKFSKPFIGIGERLSGIFLNLGHELKSAGIDLQEKEFLAIAILNSLIYFAVFLLIFFLLLFNVQHKESFESLAISMALSLVIFIMMLFVLIRYPKIIAGKRAERIDKNLIFALKDMMLQISSGVSLFNSLVNISNANYREVSSEFEKAVKDINSGMPVEKALQKLAVESSSDFLRRTIWQLVNTIRVGASLKGALIGLIDELTIEQRDKIRSYALELNMWILGYMMFAVAVPTIGATFLVILSGFGGYYITKGIFVAFILVNFAIQYILIGFVKYRRPIVNI